MARVLKPNRAKHGDSIFVMRGDRFTGTKGSDGGEVAIIGGPLPYLRVEADSRAGILTIGSRKHLRILGHALLKAAREKGE